MAHLYRADAGSAAAVGIHGQHDDIEVPRAGLEVPTLTIGLPVFNGERFLTEALDSLLAQTYRDFELVISDNASTDRTRELCLDYQARDARIRYVRLPVNIGAAPNHNFLVALARGRYFKWAAHDDVYAPTLLQHCVDVLDRDPEPILVHGWDAVIDEGGVVSHGEPYSLNTGSSRPSARLRSLLSSPVSNDMYGVIRTEALRRAPAHGSYPNADHAFIASLSLQGPFHHVPQVLYFRRDHPRRASRAPSQRARAIALDPRRGNRWLHPTGRMKLEYWLGLVTPIACSQLAVAERLRCAVTLTVWAANRLRTSCRK